MQRRKLLTVMLASAIAGAMGAAQGQTVLKFSHTDQPGGTRQKAAEMFAQKVEQATGGRYKMQVYPAGQLANDPKAVEQLQLGGIDFTVTGTGTYATHIPTLNLMLMPYLVDSYDQGWKLYDDSKWLQKQFAEGPKKGFRIIATWEAGFRSTTTKEPLNSPADAKGKKLRTYPNEMQRWLLEAMGFTVQIMPVTEVYLAIQQGTVSGQENPIDTIHANKFYEVAPHVTLTQHVYSPIPLAIAEKTWQKLSAADREAVTQGRARGGRLDAQGDPRQRRPPAEGHGIEGREDRAARPGAVPRRGAAGLRQGKGEVRRRCRRRAHRGRDDPQRAVSLLPPGPAAPAPIRALGAAVDWSVVLIGAVMVALVFANVVLHAFHRDNPWTTEFCEFLMVWVTFLGAAAATRRGLHMTHHRVRRQARAGRAPAGRTWRSRRWPRRCSRCWCGTARASCARPGTTS